MGEGETSDRSEDVSDAPLFRVRRSDVFQGITLTAFVALLGLLFGAYRDYANSVKTSVEHFQAQTAERFKEIGERLTELERAVFWRRK
jgi:hypothetical protein